MFAIYIIYIFNDKFGPFQTAPSAGILLVVFIGQVSGW